MERGTTPSQTIGPYFAIMLPLGSNELVPEDTPGALVVEGTVLDGVGAPVTDAVLEVWQADADGRYDSPADPAAGGGRAPSTSWGFGRCATDAEGRFRFRTVKPGAVPGYDERMQAPHIVVSVFARGLLRRLVTRIYFPDEQRANERDPVLGSIADEAARATLIARPVGPGRVEFDVRLGGAGETAFFDV